MALVCLESQKQIYIKNFMLSPWNVFNSGQHHCSTKDSYLIGQETWLIHIWNSFYKGKGGKCTFLSLLCTHEVFRDSYFCDPGSVYGQECYCIVWMRFKKMKGWWKVKFFLIIVKKSVLFGFFCLFLGFCFVFF